MFDFVLSFIAAAEYTDRLKRLKHKEKVLKDSRELRKRVNDTREYVQDKYVDCMLEEMIEPLTEDELYAISKNLPSYNKDAKWNVLSDEYDDFDLLQIRKRLALAKHGKLLYDDSFLRSPFKIYSNDGRRFGRDVYDYRGQIKHELYLLWEKLLKENGFEFDLLVSHEIDYGKPAFSFNTERAALARDEKYKWGNAYAWSFNVYE